MASTPCSSERQCSCGPLKKILRHFFREIVKSYNLTDRDLINVHLIQPPLLRSFTKDSCLGQVRITRATVKKLRTWSKKRAERNVSRGELRNDRMDSSDHVEGEGEDDIKFLTNVAAKVYNDLSVLIESYTVDPESGVVIFNLNRSAMIENVIRSILAKENSIKCHVKPQHIDFCVGTRDGRKSPLMEYRLSLLKQVVGKLCAYFSYPVGDVHASDLSTPNAITLVAKSNADGKVEAAMQVTVGEVKALNQLNQELSLEGILSHRLAQIEEVCRSRQDELNIFSAKELTLSTVHYDMLNQAVNNDITIEPRVNSTENGSAVQIMYNYARVVSILRKFENKVREGEYLPLPTFDEVGFPITPPGGIDVEEMNLANLLMQSHLVIESTVNFLSCEFNFTTISKFLAALSQAFNKYYRGSCILVSPGVKHLHSAMMKKIYLVKATREVYQNCMELLQMTGNISEETEFD